MSLKTLFRKKSIHTILEQVNTGGGDHDGESLGRQRLLVQESLVL